MSKKAITPKKQVIKKVPDGKGRMVFAPGVSGNPAGRPKGTFSLVAMIKSKLQEQAKDKDKTYAEYFIDQLIKKTVIEGDVTMMRDIIDRIDGKPKQTIEQETTVTGRVANINAKDATEEEIDSFLLGQLSE